MASDLSDRMTPGRSTSPSGAGGADHAGDALVAGVREAVACKTPSHRRSSVAQHSRLVEAINVASAKHRRSIAEAMAAELAATQSGDAAEPEHVPHVARAARKSLALVQRQHRDSLLRAAEVLEVAGVGIGAKGADIASPPGGSIVDEQLHLVQHALENARRRIRAQVTSAVQRAAMGTGKDSCIGAPIGSPTGKRAATAARVEQAVAAAYSKYHRPMALLHTNIVTKQGGRRHLGVHCGPTAARVEPTRPRRRA